MRARSAGAVLSRVAAARGAATLSTATVTGTARSHKVVVVGGGTAGASVSHQLLRGGQYARGDVAVVDPAVWHHYQPGWTLVGGGLKDKDDLRLRMTDVLRDPRLTLYPQAVRGFSPAENAVTLASGDRLQYEQLVVCPGIRVDYGAIKGLPEALADPDLPVSTVYGYDGVDKVFGTVERLRRGQALFTQPAGIIKCAGAPQKVMWLALDHWRRAGRYSAGDTAASDIRIAFATALPAMFGVPKYSAALEALRRERGVEGLFQHDLVEVNGDRAVFARTGETATVTRRFDLLHAVPKMGPHAFVADSPLADGAGLVAVDPATLRHATHANVWALGDAAGLPTAKTAAAVTAQAPVLVANLLAAAEGKAPTAAYDGYTSCPLTTEYGKVLLAEFQYGGTPKETFAALGVDQAVPNRAFYHLKKDFFPWVYKNYMVKGTWGGPKGFLR
ncbi:pyridine nucleotide-disulfide oxidoreductase, putative [Cordyceps militaris CM01]|uniref:Pyridine nucleotide-disulfide oxidoreductase, putative n=1 Tax=Cordyceps militaris (strain CM01) TaxID=983644 RepID=G3J971_CORMM|nr:pyridine nucleotide-disulfide oxidoreductase, putative [Cordyceps militaris CM01]EGX94900.1 pyridine nucleotide-disulfide oxidoreductase, putative [Cordyceps militaris CM01]